MPLDILYLLLYLTHVLADDFSFEVEQLLYVTFHFHYKILYIQYGKVLQNNSTVLRN